MKKQLKVIITGVGGPAGRAAAQYFHDHHFHVIGMDMNENISAPVDEFRKAYPASNQFYISQILTLAETFNVSLVVPTVSEELPELSLFRHKFLRKGIQIYISPTYPTYICNDKFYTAKMLRMHGVAVPNFVIVQENREISFPDGDFPVLAKPRVSRGGRGITIYRNAKELQRENRKDVILQEFASGDDYDVNLCVDAQAPHRILASQVLQKTSLKNGNIGNARTVKRVDEPQVKKMAERAARALGLIGPLDIDVRKKADGQPVVLEINARLGANCLTAPEVLEALVWMLRRDLGVEGKHFISQRRRIAKQRKEVFSEHYVY